MEYRTIFAFDENKCLFTFTINRFRKSFNGNLKESSVRALTNVE
jgi:hypothetical protein